MDICGHCLPAYAVPMRLGCPFLVFAAQARLGFLVDLRLFVAFGARVERRSCVTVASAAFRRFAPSTGLCHEDIQKSRCRPRCHDARSAHFCTRLHATYIPDQFGDRRGHLFEDSEGMQMLISLVTRCGGRKRTGAGNYATSTLGRCISRYRGDV